MDGSPYGGREVDILRGALRQDERTCRAELPSANGAEKSEANNAGKSETTPVRFGTEGGMTEQVQP